MTVSKYTPWFGIADTPKRVGVYEVVGGTMLAKKCRPHYSLWDGRKWCMSTSTAHEAVIQTEYSSGVESGYYKLWRGLARQP